MVEIILIFRAHSYRTNSPFFYRTTFTTFTKDEPTNSDGQKSRLLEDRRFEYVGEDGLLKKEYKSVRADDSRRYLFDDVGESVGIRGYRFALMNLMNE